MQIDRKTKIEQIKRIEANPHKFYVPTGKGEDFISDFGSDKYFITMYSAANGVGKTYTGAQILAHLIWDVGSEWFDYPLFKNWKYPKKIRIISEPTTLVSTIIPTLLSIFPKDKYKTNKLGKNHICHIATNNGWEIDLMSYDQAPKEFESATLGLVWFDEPPPESIYKASISRLRKGGCAFITATPLEGSAWMYDHIICNVDRGHGKRTYVNADIESACIEHGTRGFLRHEDIERMLSEYSEDELHARAKGLFAHLTGLVYKQWNRKVHIIRPFEINIQDYAVYEFVDTHPRNPDAVSWIAVDKYGQKFVIDELYIKVNSDEEFAQRIKEKAEKYRIVRRMIDPSAFVEDQHSEKSLATKLSEFGLNYSPAPKMRATANRRIGTALDYQEVGGNIIRTPEIYYFDTCQRHIWEMEHWRWQEWTGKSADNHNKKGVPIDKDDHTIENVGRCLVQEPPFVIYEPPRPQFLHQDDGSNTIGDGNDDPYE